MSMIGLRAMQVWVPSQFNLKSFVAGGVPEEKIRILPQVGMDGPGESEPASHSVRRTNYVRCTN